MLHLKDLTKGDDPVVSEEDYHELINFESGKYKTYFNLDKDVIREEIKTLIAERTFTEELLNSFVEDVVREARLSDSNLVAHAKRELDLLLSASHDPGDPEASEMQKKINDGIMRLVEEFALEDHSGFSASYALGIIQKLLSFRNIMPLTTNPDEWQEHGIDGEKMWQNRRSSSIFSRDGGKTAYDVEGDPKELYNVDGWTKIEQEIAQDAKFDESLEVRVKDATLSYEHEALGEAEKTDEEIRAQQMGVELIKALETYGVRQVEQAGDKHVKFHFDNLEARNAEAMNIINSIFDKYGVEPRLISLEDYVPQEEKTDTSIRDTQIVGDVLQSLKPFGLRGMSPVDSGFIFFFDDVDSLDKPAVMNTINSVLDGYGVTPPSFISLEKFEPKNPEAYIPETPPVSLADDPSDRISLSRLFDHDVPDSLDSALRSFGLSRVDFAPAAKQMLYWIDPNHFYRAYPQDADIVKLFKEVLANHHVEPHKFDIMTYREVPEGEDPDAWNNPSEATLLGRGELSDIFTVKQDL